MAKELLTDRLIEILRDYINTKYSITQYYL